MTPGILEPNFRNLRHFFLKTQKGIGAKIARGMEVENDGPKKLVLGSLGLRLKVLETEMPKG